MRYEVANTMADQLRKRGIPQVTRGFERGQYFLFCPDPKRPGYTLELRTQTAVVRVLRQLKQAMGR